MGYFPSHNAWGGGGGRRMKEKINFILLLCWSQGVPNIKSNDIKKSFQQGFLIKGKNQDHFHTGCLNVMKRRDKVKFCKFLFHTGINIW